MGWNSDGTYPIHMHLFMGGLGASTDSGVPFYGFWHDASYIPFIVNY